MNRASFALIVNDDHEILLVKSLTNQLYIDHWSLPGGVVEAGENLEEGAKREVFEEVGVVCEIERLIRQIENKEMNLTVTTFMAKYVSGDIKFQLSEISDARWFGLEETDNLLIGFNIRELFVHLGTSMNSKFID